jgi:two-component system CheB/CheR fusion protein
MAKSASRRDAGSKVSKADVPRDACPAIEGGPSGGPTGAHDEHIQRLEAELRVTRERLRTTIEALNGANEALQTVSGELARRVRDILGVVRSVVTRTVRSSDTIDELAAALNGRLETLARTQGIFTRPGISAVEMEEVIRDELVAAAAREEQIEIAGPSLRLRREAAQAMALALALHELTTNAVKYGALSEPKGRVAVRWRVVDTGQGRRLVLDWREEGVRVLDTAPSRSGFGRDLIERSLPHELGASTSLEFARGGVKASIELPLTEKIADLEAQPE